MCKKSFAAIAVVISTLTPSMIKAGVLDDLKKSEKRRQSENLESELTQQMREAQSQWEQELNSVDIINNQDKITRRLDLILNRLDTRPLVQESSGESPERAKVKRQLVEQYNNVVMTVDGTPVRVSDIAITAYYNFTKEALGQVVDLILLQHALQRYHIVPDQKMIADRLENPTPSDLIQLGFGRLSESQLRSKVIGEVVIEELIQKTKNITVTESEVRKYFDAHKENLGTPQLLRLSQLLVGGKQQAESLLMSIRGGADFAETASRASLSDKANKYNKEWGVITSETAQEWYRKAENVFKSGSGTVAGPIPYAGEYMLLKADETRPAAPASYEALRPKLEDKLLSEKCLQYYPRFIAELRKEAKITHIKPSSRQEHAQR